MKTRELALGLLMVALALAGCPASPTDGPPDAAGGGSGGGGSGGGDVDAGPGDSGMPDAGLPVYPRTLITRPLMPTSPKNLLRDPFIGGDGTTSYGQFRAFLVNGPDLTLRRTFRSVSPIGGAASIEELRGLPADAGTATSLRVMSSFHGGAGAFDGAIWLSPGDQTGAPVTFAGVAPSIAVTLLGSDGVSKTTLVAGTPKQFGDRTWVQFTTASPAAFPTGGWLTVTLTNFKLTLQLAAPEVTTSSLGAKAHRPLPAVQDEDDLRALRQAAEIDARSPDGPPYREADDR